MTSALSPLEAALLGIVEGLTEYLPVSSTGHLILAAYLLGKSGEPAVDSFNIVIQSGAILAVLGLYRERVVAMIRDSWSGARQLFSGGATLLREELGAGRLPGLQLGLNLLLAFLPAAIIGPIAKDGIKSLLFKPLPVALALALGGVVIFAFEPLRKRRLEGGLDVDSLTPLRALFIGLIQCLAMIPGTSRSLATILGGLVVGLRPAAAAEFSFLLGLPTLGGATVFEAWDDGALMIESISPLSLIVGLVVAMVSAALAVKAFVSWLNRRGLAPFGVYRILLAVAVFAVMSL